MKIKHLLVAFGLLATLTACEEGDIVIEDVEVEDVAEVASEAEEVKPEVKEELVEEPAESTLPASTPVEEPSYTLNQEDVAYLEVVNYAIEINSDTLLETFLVVNEFEKNPNLIYDDDAVSTFRTNIMKSQEVYKIMASMVDDNLVPPVFTASHDKLLVILEIQNTSFSSIFEGYLQSDTELINLGTAKMAEVSPLLKEYNSEMSEVVN